MDTVKHTKTSKCLQPEDGSFPTDIGLSTECPQIIQQRCAPLNLVVG